MVLAGPDDRLDGRDLPALTAAGGCLGGGERPGAGFAAEDRAGDLRAVCPEGGAFLRILYSGLPAVEDIQKMPAALASGSGGRPADCCSG